MIAACISGRLHQRTLQPSNQSCRRLLLGGGIQAFGAGIQPFGDLIVARALYLAAFGVFGGLRPPFRHAHFRVVAFTLYGSDEMRLKRFEAPRIKGNIYESRPASNGKLVEVRPEFTARDLESIGQIAVEQIVYVFFG